MRLLQAPQAGAASRVAVVVRDEVELLVSFTGADPGYLPAYRADVAETPVSVCLWVSEVDGHVGYRTMAGFPRWAQARLADPLGERAVVDQEGQRYAVAAQDSLLALPEPWELQRYQYSAPDADRAAAWQTQYLSGSVSAVLRQGGLDMLEVDWDRESFRPLLLARTAVRGVAGVLYTFAGEEGHNHVLAWQEGDGAAWLQVLGATGTEEILKLADLVTRPGDARSR
jgi:hypothetical protein